MKPKLDFSTAYDPIPKNGWYSIGAGGGGALFHPAVSPHERDTWMICCDMSETYVTHDAGKHWRMLNLNGMVHDIAFDPVNPNVIYAGSHGVYRSDDKGIIWKLVFPSPETVLDIVCEGWAYSFVTTDHLYERGRIQKICIDRENPDHMYVGASAAPHEMMDPARLTLFESCDGARSWKQIAAFDGSEFLLIDLAKGATNCPNKSNCTNNASKIERSLFVFTDSGYFRYDGENMLRQSVPTGEESNKIRLAAAGLHPEIKASIFYLSYEMRLEKKLGDLEDHAKTQPILRSGVYRSNDLGTTWTELTGLNADYNDPSGTRFVKHIATSYYNANKLFVSLWRIPWVLPSVGLPGTFYDVEMKHPWAGKELGPVNSLGIMTSDDFGENWRWSVQMDLTLAGNVDPGWFEMAYDVDWISSPWYFSLHDHNPNETLAALQGFIWRTEDGGDSWYQTYSDGYTDGSWYGRGLESTTCYDVVFDPHHKDNLLITYTDNGLFRSENGGKSWKHSIQGVPYSWINTCYAVAFDTEAPGLAWGAWTSIHDLPGPRAFLNKVFDKPFAAGGICVTRDGGATWQNATDLYAKGSAFTYVILDPTSPVGNRTLYAAKMPGGVLKSTDNGQTWVEKSNGIVKENDHIFILSLIHNTLYAISARTRWDKELASEDERFISDGAIYVSANGVESWKRLTLPAFVTHPNRIAADPVDPNLLYFTSFPVKDGDEYKGGGVYRSYDGGKTWECLFDERVRVKGTQIDPKNRAHIYITTAEFSAYRSLDGGKTWERIRGYNFKTGTNPILDPYNDEMMYITTFGGGVFYGPRAGGNERYDDIIGFRLNHSLE